KPRRGGRRRREDNEAVKTEDRGSRMEDRRSLHPLDPRSKSGFRSRLRDQPRGGTGITGERKRRIIAHLLHPFDPRAPRGKPVLPYTDLKSDLGQNMSGFSKACCVNISSFNPVLKRMSSSVKIVLVPSAGVLISTRFATQMPEIFSRLPAFRIRCFW